MPKQLHDADQFEKLMPKALELRVFREKEFVKLKLRTPDFLYTLKTNEDEAAGIIKNVKDLEVIEINPKREKETKEEKKPD
jgi:hypothetical protein